MACSARRPRTINAPMTDPLLLLGHRGSRRRTTPENTFAAFDASLDDGCDGFEFDVRRTSDGRAVVIHNPSHKGIPVAKAGIGQLKALPGMEQVLEKYGPRGFLDIELKVPGLEPALVAALGVSPPQRGYVVSSFLPEVLLAIRARRSAIPLGIICGRPSQLKSAASLPVDFVIVEQALVNPALVEETHAAGRKLLVWTVNQPGAMRRLAAWGVDGLISDDPALLARTLDRGDVTRELPPKLGPKARGRVRSRGD